METAVATILLTLVVSLAGSAAQATVGFGIALLLSPVMFMLLDAEEAVLCTVTASTGLSVLVLFRERHRLALDRGVLVGMLVPVVPGVVLGTLLLGVIEKAYLQILVGLVVLAAVALQEGSRRGTPAKPMTPSPSSLRITS